MFVSGLNYPGAPNQVLVQFIKGEIEAFVSPFILAELERILIEKFRWSPNQIQATLNLITGRASVIEPANKISIITRKDDDNRILECAFEAQARFLITGDGRDLLPLKEFQGLQIINPRQFLSLQRESQDSRGN